MTIFMSKYNAFKVIVVLLLSFAIIIQPVICNAESDLKLHALSYALIDGQTGRILIEKNGFEEKSNASTTKILTCILALEKGDLEEFVEFSSNASKQPEVHLGVKKGTKIKLKDLLLCLMLESFNDCAVAIAENIGGSVEEFATLMNEKAKEIGCTDSYFITPNGLDKEDETSFHHSSAVDLCRIMKYCCFESVKKDAFKKICKTTDYSFNDSENKTYKITNKNRLIYDYDSILSGKTGYTSKAGYCYVAAFEEDNKKYCLCVLACGWPNHKDFKWEDTKKLLSYVRENYELFDFSPPPDLAEYEIKMEGFEEKPSLEQWKSLHKIDFYINGNSKSCLISKVDKTDMDLYFFDDITRSVRKGQNIGRINHYLNEENTNTYNIVSNSTINKWDFKTLFYAILRKYFLL